MRETGESISQWAEETFGPAVSLARIASRALKEMSELVDKVTHPEPDPKAIAAECADVVIVLARLAHRCGGDIFEPTPEHWFQYQLPYPMVIHALSEISSILTLADMMPDHFTMVMRSRKAGTYLAEVCGSLGHNLRAEIDAKMAINRARKWVLDGTGHGQHVRDDTSPSVPGTRSPHR